MGAQNVGLVYLYWSHLADRPFRVLAYMALVSMDTDCPPRYWGGYPALARAIGRSTSDTFDKASANAAEVRAKKADMEAVRNALGPLLDASVVVMDRPESPGKGPEFALLLDERSRRSLLDGPGEVCSRSRRSLPTVQANPADLGGVGGETLQEEQEETHRNTPGTTSPNASTSPANPGAEIAKPEIDPDAERNRQTGDLAEWAAKNWKGKAS